MKRLIIILILLIATPLWAGDVSSIMGKAIASIATICGKAKAAVASWGGGGVPVAGGDSLKISSGSNDQSSDRYFGNNTITTIAESFSTGVSPGAFTLTSIKFLLDKEGAGGSCTLTGGIWNSAGTLLYSSTNTVDSSTLSNSLVTFEFDNESLSASTTYRIGVYADSGTCGAFDSRPIAPYQSTGAGDAGYYSTGDLWDYGWTWNFTWEIWGY
jgi:hypothetical protein